MTYSSWLQWIELCCVPTFLDWSKSSSLIHWTTLQSWWSYSSRLDPCLEAWSRNIWWSLQCERWRGHHVWGLIRDLVAPLDLVVLRIHVYVGVDVRRRHHRLLLIECQSHIGYRIFLHPPCLLIDELVILNGGRWVLPVRIVDFTVRKHRIHLDLVDLHGTVSPWHLISQASQLSLPLHDARLGSAIVPGWHDPVGENDLGIVQVGGREHIWCLLRWL